MIKGQDDKKVIIPDAIAKMSADQLRETLVSTLEALTNTRKELRALQRNSPQRINGWTVVPGESDASIMGGGR